MKFLILKSITKKRGEGTSFMCDSYIELTLFEYIFIGVVFVSVPVSLIALWEWLLRDFLLGLLA